MARIIIISILIFLSSCMVWEESNTPNYCGNNRINRAGKSANICKELKENMIVYCVFVDDKSSGKWYDFDIEESKKSVDKALVWIKTQAKMNDVNLNITTAFHSLKDSVHAIEKNLAYKSLNNHLWMEGGMKKLQKWSNNIATQVNSDLFIKNNLIKKDIKTRDELIANLQAIYKEQNIVLLYFLNNKIRQESSVTLYTTIKDSNLNTSEYSIIAEPRNETVIAHEILHLFGADDFYSIQYGRIKLDKETRKKYRLKQKYTQQAIATNNKTNILREYPNAIMRNINFDNLDSLSVSPITQYLIGWQTKYELTMRDKELMLYGDYIELD